MRFLFPSLFYFWALLVLVPIVLYLFRPRPKTVKTSTLPFFKWLDRAHQDSAWLRWLKYLLSLLLSVTVVLAGAAALARLVMAPSADQIKTVVIVVDRSVSMDALDAEGRNRLDEAKAALAERADGLNAGVGVVVIAYDTRPEVLLARSVDRRQVQRALAAIKTRPIEGHPKPAIALARQLAALETPAAIWHATDHAEETSEFAESARDEPPSDTEATDDADKPADPSEIVVEHMAFTLSDPQNVGITTVDFRRLPLERGTFEAFVQVQAAGGKEVSATLDVLLDGEEVDLREFTLTAGKTETLLVEIKADAETDRIAELRLLAENDQLAADNVVYAHIPKLKPIKVLWVSETPDPYTELALASMGADNDVEVFQALPSAWPTKEDVDVVIFDGWLPESWPASLAAIVVNPPGSVGPIQAVRLKDGGLPVADLRAAGEGHALLYGVATARVEVNQTAVLRADGPLQPIWVSDHGPLLLAGKAQGQRISVFGFDPQLSPELPYLASYPLLIGNAIYWAAEEELKKTRGINRRTGELVQVDGRLLKWLDPENLDRAIREVPLDKATVELDQLGLWKTESGQIGSASLLSSTETRLPSRESATDSENQSSHSASLMRGDLSPVLMWIILIILIVESFLYHRCFTN